LKTKSLDIPNSDHEGVVISFGKPHTKPVRRTIKTWRFTNEIRDFARQNPPSVNEEITDVNLLAGHLTDWLTNINKLASGTKTVTYPQSNNPWYSPELAALRTNYTNLPSGIERNKLRNYYVSQVRRAKRDYLRNLAIRYHLSGGVWKVLRKKNHNADNWKMKIQGSDSTDKEKIADNFLRPLQIQNRKPEETTRSLQNTVRNQG